MPGLDIRPRYTCSHCGHAVNFELNGKPCIRCEAGYERAELPTDRVESLKKPSG